MLGIIVWIKDITFFTCRQLIIILYEPFHFPVLQHVHGAAEHSTNLSGICQWAGSHRLAQARTMVKQGCVLVCCIHYSSQIISSDKFHASIMVIASSLATPDCLKDPKLGLPPPSPVYFLAEENKYSIF